MIAWWCCNKWLWTCLRPTATAMLPAVMLSTSLWLSASTHSKRLIRSLHKPNQKKTCLDLLKIWHKTRTINSLNSVSVTFVLFLLLPTLMIFKLWLFWLFLYIHSQCLNKNLFTIWQEIIFTISWDGQETFRMRLMNKEHFPFEFVTILFFQ